SHCEYDMKFKVGVQRNVVIYGKHSGGRLGRKQIVLDYGTTFLDASDWEAIKTEYANCYQIKSGLIFADKKDKDTKVRAIDESTEAHKTGASPLTEEDLKGAEVNPTLV